MECETLEEIKSGISDLLYEYDGAETNADDRATLRVATFILDKWDKDYLFETNEEPSVCPTCAEEMSETQEYTIEDGEKFQTYGYQCLSCTFAWKEFYKYGGFMSWKPVGTMSKWDARGIFNREYNEGLQ
jgi:hypothetical protein